MYTTVSGETHPATQLQNTYFKITGDPAKYKNIKQNVVVKGNAGDSFVLAGWAKGRSAPLSGDRKFAIRARFNYTDGTTSSYFDAKFNTAVDQWQYSAVAMVAGKAYSSITVAAVYDYNVNTVYFDGIQLYKEEFGSSYTYDTKGNVISVTDLQKQTTTYEYDTNSNLTKIIQNGNAKMTYTYDGFHNVKTATTDEGVVYNFEYDTYGNNTRVSIGNGSTKISSSATYSTNGNYLVSTRDALDKETTYGYNENTNVLEWVQYPEDTAATRTEYEYDTMYRMAKAECTTDTGLNQQAVYGYDENGRLFTISSPTTFYIFGYRAFGQRGAVTVSGLYFLATYEYTEDANRYLQQITYGNNHFVNYTYDSKGRLLTQTYEDGDTVSYTYDNNGALAKVKDSATGRTTTYYYDLTDRMMKYVEKGTNYSHSVGYEYDTKNNLTQLVEEINGTKHTTTYDYDEDNRVTTLNADGTTVAYTYDNLGRLTTQVTKDSGNTPILTEEYTYVKPTINGVTVESSQISQYKVIRGSTVTTYNYTYDDNGNILSITEEHRNSNDDVEATYVTSYVYDSANQLIRENNQAGGFTYTWEYNAGGNILNRKEYAYTTESLDGVTPTKTATYGYENAFWGDLLTSYDGKAIVQDNIGNTTDYDEWVFTWEHGRQLAKAKKNNVEWTYTYNADGMRAGRTNGTTTYSYVYNGSQLTRMTVNDEVLDFTYDANGTPLTVTWNGTVYYYVTNLQGDVLQIRNTEGNLIAQYTYDAWGKLRYIDGALMLCAYNPLLYRGYVFDLETGLYYLQSRYYDPEIGRFLNADAFTSTGQGFSGNNMFAYCGNNPVTRIDTSGEFFNTICGALVGGIISALTFDNSGGETWQQAFVRGAVAGAIAGAGLDICVATGGVGAALIVSGVAGAGAAMIDTAWEAKNNKRSVTASEVVSSGVIGGGLNVLFGAAGRETTNIMGDTLKSVGKAIVRNTAKSVTNKAGKIVFKKVASEFAKNTAYSSLQAAAAKVYYLISLKMGEIIGE